MLSAMLLAGAVFLDTSVTNSQTEDVRVVIYQSYEFRGPSELTYQIMDSVELPILDIVEDMVFATGRDVLDADDTNTHDAKLSIRLLGRALGRRYIEAEGQYFYTGAILDGVVLLRAGVGNSHRREFYSLTSMPFELPIVNLGYDNPYNAPFDETLDQSHGLFRAIAEVMAEAWGVEAIVPVAYVSRASRFGST